MANQVHKARERYSVFMDADNAPKTGGDDTLQEINYAVSFLMEAGLALNADFTISNAVALAKTRASETLDTHLQAKDTDGDGVWQDASQFNILLSDGSKVDTTKYVFSYYDKNINTKPLDLVGGDGTDESFESNGQMRDLNLHGGYYTVSFKDSPTPTYNMVCDN